MSHSEERSDENAVYVTLNFNTSMFSCSFTDFHKRFEILCFKDGLVSTRKATPEENMAAAIHICGKCLDPTEYAKGKTRMFLRNGLLEKLQQVRHWELYIYFAEH